MTDKCKLCTFFHTMFLLKDKRKDTGELNSTFTMIIAIKLSLNIIFKIILKQEFFFLNH